MMIEKPSFSKMVLPIALAALVGTAAYSADSADPQASADCWAYGGVWQYDVKGIEGMMIVSGNKAIGVMVTKGRATKGD